MKKLRIVVLSIILAFSFSVKAEVFFEIDCNSKDITSSKSVTCEGNLSYETEGINDIELSYQTNLDIKFIPVDGFTINKSNGKVNIHTDDPLYDDLMMSSKIMEFTLSSNDNSKENEVLKFYNIRINKNNTNVTDDLEETFNVTLNKEIKLDNVCTLDSISVDGNKIPNYDKNKFEYHDIKVNKRVVYIDATRTSDKSSATELGGVVAPEGEETLHKVIVTAEDGTKCIYKLYLTNTLTKPTPFPTSTPTIEEEKSNDNSLKTLEIYHKKDKVSFEFDKNQDNYDIDIEKYDDDKITLKATLNNDKASFVAGLGPRDIKLVLNENKVLIKIKAENGEERIITLNINYLDNRDKDNTLLSLKINDEFINLADEKYEIKVAHDIDKAKIEATPNSDKAIVQYEDVELSFGDNEVKITVTSENGESKEYDVNVLREEKEEVLLQNIEIVGYNLGFNKETKTYDLKINHDTNKLDIKVLPETLTFDALNNNDLKNASKVIVKVIDSDGLHEYTINIIKEEDNAIICYAVFGLGIITFITSIIYVIKKKHS